MRRKVTVLAVENELLVDLALHNILVSLITEFVEKLAKPYFRGNINAAIQDLIRGALAEQDFVFPLLIFEILVGTSHLGKTVPSFRMALEFEIERWKRVLKGPSK